MENLIEKIKDGFFPKSKQAIVKGIKNSLVSKKLLKNNLIAVEVDFEKCVSEIDDSELKKSFEDAFFNDLYSISEDIKKVNEKLILSSEKLSNSILKSDDFKYKNEMKNSLNISRDSMPQISSDNLTDFIVHFADKTNVKKVKKSIATLKPTQNEINDEKVLKIIKDYYKEDGFKNRYIISNDNYLLDGHHRWAAELELDNNKKVTCYKIDLPIKELLSRSRRLGLITKKDINDNDVSKAFEIEESEFINSNLKISKAFENGLITKDILEKVILLNKSMKKITKIINDEEKVFYIRNI